MGLNKLRKKLDILKDELYDLHLAEPSIELYNQKRHDIEYEIACTEELIELEERLKPLRIGIVIFIIAGTSLMITAFILH